MENLPTPNDREEKILYAIATGDTSDLPTPKTRTEKLLMGILENGSMSGGGGSGTSDVAWKPTVAADGTISWIRSISTTQPATQNIMGPKGDPGPEGKSAYQIWLDAGNTGTEDDFLLALIGAPGPEGKSVYQLWLDLGNTGTEQEFIDSLIGEDGKSAYEIWLEQGNVGTEQDFLDSLKGDGSDIEVDETLSTTSTNPIQNKAVAEKFNEIDERLEELGSDTPNPVAYKHTIKVFGTIGQDYYATSLDEYNIRQVYETGQPAELRFGWTIDRVESDDASISAFSNFEKCIDKNITATGVNVYNVFDISAIDGSYTEYTVVYEWNDLKKQSTITYNSIEEMCTLKGIDEADLYTSDKKEEAIITALDYNEELVLVPYTLSELGVDWDKYGTYKISKIVFQKNKEYGSIVAILDNGVTISKVIDLSNSSNSTDWIRLELNENAATVFTSLESLNNAKGTTIELEENTDNSYKIKNELDDKEVFIITDTDGKYWDIENELCLLCLGDINGCDFAVSSDNTILYMRASSFNYWAEIKAIDFKIDEELNENSENPIQNKAVYEAIKFHKNIYNSRQELNQKISGNISNVSGTDSTPEIIEALDADECYIDGFGYSDTYGIDEDKYGPIISEIRFFKTAADDCSIIAFMQSGKILHREKRWGELGDWICLNEIDSALDSTSENPIQNRAVALEFEKTATKEYVAEQISNTVHLTKEIVDAPPTIDEAKENVIYMVKDDTVTSGDMYKEYQLINGNVVQTGDTSIDLSSYAKTYTSLDVLGLTAPVTVGDIFNSMPDKTMAIISCEDITVHITDAPTSYGILTIKKNEVGRFSIDYQTSLASSPCNVKKWIGTLKGDDGTGLYWKEVAYKDNLAIYKSLSELGLDTTATLKDITRAMAKNSMIAIKVDAMADQSEYNSITQGTVTIYKIEDARIQAIMTEKSTGRTWVGILGGENTIIGWKELRSDSPFYRIVTQGVAGYFKFKPTSTGIDQPLRISVTDNYGGMINISGATPSATQYKPFKCIRLSNGTYADYDAIKTTNNKMEKLYFYDGYFYLKVVAYTTCTFTDLIEQPTYVETFDETVAEEIPIRSVFDTPYNDGYADPNIIAIGDADSADGVIKTLGTLGFTGDIMTWYTGEYRISHVAGLTNLPTEITEEKPGFRLAHYDVKKWGSNHNPYVSTYGCRQSVLHYKGNIFVRYIESGANAGVLITDTGWRKINTNNSTTLVTNTSTLKLDITKKNVAWYGAIKLTYLYDTSPVEVEIDFKSATDTLKWTISKGQKYIKKITYTQDSTNNAHYTIGIEFSGATYGCYQAEVIGGFADINSLTADAFTGDITAVYGNPYGKNNGVTLVSAPEDLGLTSPCTTVQLVQAMRNTFNKTITSGAIGIFNNGGNIITDAPSDYGLLHIECFGHDRMLIRYDGIGSSIYAGSWIGRVKGNNGTFSEVTWEQFGYNDVEKTNLTIGVTTSSTGTINNYFVKKGICYVNYYLTLKNNAVADKLFTNLPAPAEEMYVMLSGGHAASLSVGSNNLLTLGTIPAGTNLIGGFSYPVA